MNTRLVWTSTGECFWSFDEKNCFRLFPMHFGLPISVRGDSTRDSFVPEHCFSTFSIVQANRPKSGTFSTKKGRSQRRNVKAYHVGTHLTIAFAPGNVTSFPPRPLQLTRSAASISCHHSGNGALTSIPMASIVRLLACRQNFWSSRASFKSF